MARQKKKVQTEAPLGAATPAPVEAAPVEATPTASDSGRKARWEEFLAKARSERPDPTIFDEQRERGEFDVIPDSFK